MFTVNKTFIRDMFFAKQFQNISCLRLILESDIIERVKSLFQNISCLRLIQDRENDKIIIE